MTQNNGRSRRGCLLSPALFNIFLERIMPDAPKEHDGKTSVGGRNNNNLRFADDTDVVVKDVPDRKSRQNLHNVSDRDQC